MSPKLRYNKLLHYLLLSLLLAFHFWFGVSKGWNSANTDFTNYYVSAQLLQQGKLDSSYNDVIFQQEVSTYAKGARGQFSLYPPWCATVAIPLITFPLMQAKRVWLGFSLCCLAVLIFIFSKLAGVPILYSAVCVGIYGFNLTNDLFLGQIYIFTTMMMMLAIYCVSKQAQVFAILAATIASLKLVTIAWLSLVVKKQYRCHALLICLGLLLINGLLICFCGISSYVTYFSARLMPYINGQVFSELPYDYAYQSFHSLFANLFLKDELLNPHPVFESSTGYWFMIMLLRGISISFIIYVLFLFNREKISVEVFLSLLVLVILAFEPGSASYHLLLSIPAFALCIKKFSHSIRKVATASTFVLLTGFMPTFIEKYLVTQTDFALLHYSRLFLAILMLFYMFYTLAIQNKNQVVNNAS